MWMRRRIWSLRPGEGAAGDERSKGDRADPAGTRLFFFRLFPFFDRHIFELARFEDVSALLAFDVFGIFIAGDDLNPRMFALFGTGSFLGGLRRLARRHKLADYSSLKKKIM